MKSFKELKIAICNDHAGFVLKQQICDYLYDLGIVTLEDFGANSSDSCDYADFAHPLALGIKSGKYDLGISICGSGNGISMTLNKHSGIRAALCWEVEIAVLARQHNNANIISLPARFVDETKALEMIDAFLSTEFDGGRHQARIDKMDTGTYLVQS